MKILMFQIDGIFASMGVDGELSEESFLNFLKKGEKRSKNNISSTFNA